MVLVILFVVLVVLEVVLQLLLLQLLLLQLRVLLKPPSPLGGGIFSSASGITKLSKVAGDMLSLLQHLGEHAPALSISFTKGLQRLVDL